MKSNSQLFKLGNLHFEGYPEIRLTIDNPQDYALACTLRFLLEQLQAELPIMDKIKKMVEEYAWITKINHQNLQVPAFRNQKEEFAFALTMLEPYEMMQVKKALSDYIDE
jgi:hypothetical protein